MTASNGGSSSARLHVPRLHCGVVLRVDEDACQVLAGGQVVSVRYASQFPSPRRERVSPGHLVAIAEVPGGSAQVPGGSAQVPGGSAAVPGGSAAVVWRWYDAVVLGTEPAGVRFWEPAHGEVLARPRHPGQRHDAGTRAYLSAGLPGADWWAAGPAVDRAEDADVELNEVERLYTEHGLWASVFDGEQPAP